MVFAGIESGRTKICKNSLGGISKLWLFPFVNYSRSQIVTNGNILTTFPTTTIYQFNFNGDPSPSETQTENEGGKFYELSLSFVLAKSTDSFNIEKLIKKDYRLIFQDRNGLFRIFGLYTGMICENITYTTGSAKSDLNGFTIDFKGQEEKGSFFINDLDDAGFFDAGEDYRITELGEFRITENNNFRITE